MRNKKKEKIKDELNFLNELLNAPFMNDRDWGLFVYGKIKERKEKLEGKDGL